MWKGYDHSKTHPNAVPVPAHGHLTLKHEAVQCGKSCKSCPHHAYWYGYLRVGGRLHKIYFGKDRPDLSAIVAKLQVKGLVSTGKTPGQEVPSNQLI
jgi:hypothetical protein